VRTILKHRNMVEKESPTERKLSGGNSNGTQAPQDTQKETKALNYGKPKRKKKNASSKTRDESYRIILKNETNQTQKAKVYRYLLTCKVGQSSRELMQSLGIERASINRTICDLKYDKVVYVDEVRFDPNTKRDVERYKAVPLSQTKPKAEEKKSEAFSVILDDETAKQIELFNTYGKADTSHD